MLQKQGGKEKTPLNLASAALSLIVEPVQSQIGNQAKKLKTKIPINMLPLTLYFSKTIIETKAKQPNKTNGFLIFPSVTKVTG